MSFKIIEKRGKPARDFRQKKTPDFGPKRRWDDEYRCTPFYREGGCYCVLFPHWLVVVVVVVVVDSWGGEVAYI